MSCFNTNSIRKPPLLAVTRAKLAIAQIHGIFATFALGDYCAIPKVSKIADTWICAITYTYLPCNSSAWHATTMNKQQLGVH